jgi:seryl-tRNA synthetase
MLDINFIKENKEKIKENCQKRGVDLDVDKMIKINEDRKVFLRQIEEIRAEKNKATKAIPQMKDEKEKKKLIKKMQEISKEEEVLEEQLEKKEKEYNGLAFKLPNLCQTEVPVGKDDCDNVVLREEGRKPSFKFKAKDHLELAEAKDLIDVKRAAKVSGSRFGYIKGEIAQMEFALVRLAFDRICQKGFQPIIPPVLIRPEMMWGMGYIDTEEDLAERYYLDKDNLFLVGTAEQSIGPMHKDEIFQESDLPKRYIGFSSCFREEAGSYGKDTMGILRVHQFDKVEMFSFCHPKDSKKEQKIILGLAESLIKELEIPYRVMQLCTGDLASPSSATYDIESWLPGQNKYRETHSCSLCTDFQSRRLNIRYKDKETNKLNFVHTLNGTAFAIGRTLIAIIENYQQEDGSIKVPKVLQKYLNFKIIN